MNVIFAKKIALLVIPSCSLFMLSSAIYAQTIQSSGQQLQAPIIIPASRTGMQAPPVARTSTVTNTTTSSTPSSVKLTSSQSADNVRNATPAPTPKPSVVDNDTLANELRQDMSPIGTQPMRVTKTSRDGLTDAERSEMVARMRKAVEQIASEYGNPVFAQVFTNDQVQAQVLRKRIQMLQRVENIQAEIATLDNQKQQAQQDLAATRRDMIALQEQADALTARIQKARRALELASQ